MMKTRTTTRCSAVPTTRPPVRLRTSKQEAGLAFVRGVYSEPVWA
jgi:hypothetical protein